jgi:membrane protease YdiL (CAAX protease family)
MLVRLARSVLKDVEQTPRVSAPSAAARARAVIARRPILIAVLLTLVWHAVLFALVDTISSLQPHWFPDLGYTLINLGAAAVPIGLILWLGWTRSAGLAWRRPDRSWWLVTPLVLEALSYSINGVAGSARELLSAAVLYTAIGISEETISRGLVQRVLAGVGPVRAAVWVGVLFGAGHTLSGIWFSHPVGDTIYISINAAAFGFACAALRWHLRTIWPLVAVHALGDFIQILSPGNLPFEVRVAYLLGFVAYGWWLLRRLPDDATGASLGNRTRCVGGGLILPSGSQDLIG